LPSARPSIRTPPASATSAANERENPSILASAASTRAVEAVGHGRTRDGIRTRARGRRVVLAGRAEAVTVDSPTARARGAVEANADQHQQRDADHHRHDEHVGDVVDRGIHAQPHPGRVDEVDDVADQEAGVAERAGR
jgi:hypothetical protein